jgi:daunorubicin/doxorubicin transport system ATP-binding protein
MLATLLRPDAGTARVLGHDVEREADAVRARISLTGQLASVDDDLSGFENLVLLGRLLGHSRHDAKRRAAELLEAFGLADAAGRLVKSYSGGMRRRLDVAASIIVRPDLLFLDEPTTGLDPRSRSQVWGLVRALVARGTTVLLTTQYLDEADQLADRIAVVDRGTVIAEGTSGELKTSAGRGALHVRVRDPHRRVEAQRLLARALDMQVRLEADPSALSATVFDPGRVAQALAELSRTGTAVSEFALGQPSLDEVFLALTGRPTTNDTIEEEAA